MNRMLQRTFVPALALLVPALVASACADNDGIDDGAPESAGNSGTGVGGKDGAGGKGGNGGKGGAGGSSAQGGVNGGDAGALGLAGEGGTGNGEAGAAGDGGMGGGNDPGVIGDTYLLTSANHLLFVNRASGAVASMATVSGLTAGEVIVGMDTRPSDGVLYALTSAGKVYTLNTATGAATLKATLAADPTDATDPFVALAGSQFGVDFNPVANRLRVVSSSGQDLRINVDATSGNTITDSALNPGNPTVTAAAYTNSFGAACRTRLYVIDSTSNALLLQDPPNDGKLSAVGSLGVDVVATNGFEIVTNGSGVNAGLVVSGKNLYDIDLNTGAATNPRTVALDGNETVIGIGVAPPAQAPLQAFGELLGVSVSNRLVSLNRSAPGKLCTSSAITGLAAGEDVLGIDVRPTDGALYALGSSGRLYTLNAATGAATLKSVMAADPADATAPFTALSGTNYGVGFNPVADRLRIVSDSGQNLRVNVDNNAGTTTDATLNAGTPSVTAAAYSNSFTGARSTSLFGLDTVADTLVVIGTDPGVSLSPAPVPVCPTDVGNPNCGVVNTIGPLGIGDVTGVNGFDIDGKTGVAGSALAALTIGAATTSSLFSIDLATGAASNPPGVANPTIGGGEQLRGLTFAANPGVSVLALSSDNHLVRFAASNPNTLTSDVIVSGLQTNEDLLGLDIRPLDGKAYSVGSSGRLYTLDPASGAATLVGVLSAAAGDDNPFTALSVGGAYGLDFNPVPDLLRLVSSSAENLRIVPSARSLNAVAQVSGATFTDTLLTPVTADIVASAYTNNFAGTALTTLYGIDATLDALFRQGGADGTPSPNTGALTLVGLLGVDVIGEAGFDVAGARDGLALASIHTADTGTSSRLYTVNLATGAAAAYPVTTGTAIIGTLGTTPQIRGLTIDLK